MGSAYSMGMWVTWTSAVIASKPSDATIAATPAGWKLGWMFLSVTVNTMTPATYAA